MNSGPVSFGDSGLFAAAGELGELALGFAPGEFVPAGGSIVLSIVRVIPSFATGQWLRPKN